MKKQIVINASKDRSRIAIVEDGELVELYIETPDNVRSIGNVYLASIQKVMPALRAAFVDVGQKQDCFLHFSDLTDNLPQLLALAGEDVPGLDEPVLSLAPAKRVADDEDEPDVEDALEVEPTPEESRSRRTSRRRSRGRGRGRGRGKGREEEEEQEETPRRPLPSVIDLSGPSKPRRRAAPAAQRAEATPDAESPSDAAESSDASSADASAPVEEAAPDKKRSRRRSRAESAPDDGAETGTAETGGPASEDADPSATDEDRPARKRRRRGRRGGRGTSADAPAQTDNSDAASEDAETERPPRGQRTSRKADRSGEPASDESATDEEPSNEESSDGSGPEADDDTTNGRSRRSSRGTSRSGRAGTAPDADDPDRQPGGDKGDAPAKKKTAGRKALPATLDLTSSAKRLADDTADEGRENGRSRRRDRSEDDASGGPAADETSPRGFKKPSRRRAQDADPSEGADTSGDAQSDDSQTDDSQADDSQADPSSRRGRRGGGRRSQDASGGPAGGESQETDRSEGDGSGDPPSGRSRGGRSGRFSDEASSGRGSGRTSKGDDSEGGRQGSRSGGGRAGGRGGRTSGRGSIPSNEELLKRDGRIIVKITKEAISNKGPRVSTDLSLAGRFLVLVPAADYVAVSKKIESAKERRRLRTLATSLKPDGFGVIVRTVAEGRDAKSLDTDLRLLADKWRKIQSKLDEKPSPPVLLYQDVNMVSSVIRDLFSEDYDRILVDDPKVFKNVQAYVKAVAPQMADKVELHQGRGQVFRSLGIEKQVEEAFSKRVNMRGGGYLFIETTEAMHVVDVNSGRAGRGKSQKQNLIDVNVEAAREVAKQLRLRDLGGIIVVDFIDLKYDRDRRKVTDALKKAFEKDRAVTKLLPMSDFGLVQITRQRLRPSITANAVDEDGERLEGADAMEAAGAAEIVQPGKSLDAGEPEAHRDDRRDDRRGERAAEARPAEARAESRPALAPEEATPQALAGRLRGWLDHYRQSVDEKYRGRPVVVRVHPLFGAYLRRGFPSTLTRWRLAVRGIAFSVEEDPSVDPLAFDVRDQKSGRSLLKKYTA